MRNARLSFRSFLREHSRKFQSRVARVAAGRVAQSS